MCETGRAGEWAHGGARREQQPACALVLRVHERLTAEQQQRGIVLQQLPAPAEALEHLEEQVVEAINKADLTEDERQYADLEVIPMMVTLLAVW